MKHITQSDIWCSLFMAVLFLLSPFIAAQDYRSSVCKKINVAGPDQWSPNSYFDPVSQTHRGLGYELLHRIAEKQQIPYEILRDLPWQRVLKYTQEGQVDIIVAIYQSLQRESFVEFSEPYFTNNIKIYVLKGEEFNFTSLQDLSGKKGLYPSGASYGDEFDAFAQTQDLFGKTNIDELFMYLARGTVEYAIQESTRAALFLAEHTEYQNIVALKQPLLDVSVRLGFSRNSRCTALLKKFKAEFQHMLTTGELARLQSSYINNSR